MAFDLVSLVRRIEWLEKAIRAILRRLEELADALGQLGLVVGGGGRIDRESIVIVRPMETIAPATFHDPVGSTPARIVPTSGPARLWRPYALATGEMRQLNTIRRWDEDEEEFIDEDATIFIDNINPSEAIPGTARYVICARHGQRLRAISWECDPSA